MVLIFHVDSTSIRLQRSSISFPVSMLTYFLVLERCMLLLVWQDSHQVGSSSLHFFQYLISFFNEVERTGLRFMYRLKPFLVTVLKKQFFPLQRYYICKGKKCILVVVVVAVPLKRKYFRNYYLRTPMILYKKWQ